MPPCQRHWLLHKGQAREGLSIQIAFSGSSFVPALQRVASPERRESPLHDKAALGVQAFAPSSGLAVQAFDPAAENSETFVMDERRIGIDIPNATHYILSNQADRFKDISSRYWTPSEKYARCNLRRCAICWRYLNEN